MQLSENWEAVNPLILTAGQALRLDLGWGQGEKSAEGFPSLQSPTNSLPPALSHLWVREAMMPLVSLQRMLICVVSLHLRTGKQYSLCPCLGLVDVTLQGTDLTK